MAKLTVLMGAPGAGKSTYASRFQNVVTNDGARGHGEQAGETLHTALHREVDEETALKIEIVDLAAWREVVPGTGGGGHYLIMSFAARWTSGGSASRWPRSSRPLYRTSTRTSWPSPTRRSVR